ncbi:enoyl-CoA hydratase/isomerase family protein [Lutimaribacter sp. EGI FJ00015]|uniref:Enoyl-CoA hydratase/isomerase family protein n=1 Tax=Lutimaribacter degradans TaxID=2945989 RepID=A0ACC5ZVP4_9RHOB|nr:enoyl-CoA hydratase/isomerase family protein [Lutimaribacter sp. EGI FJ00013]MCM2562170.1 enoyl-CoA hydratase/isomerase family protein [Lutimaribacter sp. EGI FJ00013]MCO0613324.1 enoyl-CoA hydratase/isomerase family protein [Lutimaribacter sp. EGI FJ00015]MCO0636299.1 enoyl-CoA hydratase/isomerase family protein [Lutimaribacter sp. EGI FJ00014]
MTEIDIRTEGRAGRITLNRPKALNALTYDMAMALHAALRDWRHDDAVRVVVIDAAGDKAFCAGGDIADLYRSGTEGDFTYGRTFWADEYRMNAALFEFPKPVISLMQGFVMGGGVGVGCHGSHRVVGDSSQIAMPECGIGLVPDVGGSLLLARAPGRLGEYLGLTAARMGPGDAIVAGFADHYLPEDQWPALIARLCETGDAADVAAAALPTPQGTLAPQMDRINALFNEGSLPAILAALRADDSELAASALKSITRNSPLSMAVTLEMLKRLRAGAGIRAALDMEYRFTWRAMEQADFLEGVRAAIIDKDRNPQWRHDLDTVSPDDVAALLEPLGADALTFEEEE